MAGANTFFLSRLKLDQMSQSARKMYVRAGKSKHVDEKLKCVRSLFAYSMSMLSLTLTPLICYHLCDLSSTYMLGHTLQSLIVHTWREE